MAEANTDADVSHQEVQAHQCSSVCTVIQISEPIEPYPPTNQNSDLNGDHDSHEGATLPSYTEQVDHGYHHGEGRTVQVDLHHRQSSDHVQQPEEAGNPFNPSQDEPADSIQPSLRHESCQTVETWQEEYIDLDMPVESPIRTDLPRSCHRNNNCCHLPPARSHIVSEPSLICHDRGIVEGLTGRHTGTTDCNHHNDRHRRSQRRGRRHRERTRRRRRRQTTDLSHGHPEDDLKPCCSVLGCKICLSLCLQFKKVLIFLASVGGVCIMVGIVLGILRAPQNSFLTLALMFVGLGLLLLTVVLVGWRCTPPDHEPCHMLFSLGAYSRVSRRGRRRRERLYWLGGMLYPEFRHRRPPPSYSSAVHDSRPDSLRHLQTISVISDCDYPESPPPSYKSHPGVSRPGIHIIFPRNEDQPTSNPPTYRLTRRQHRTSAQEMENIINQNMSVDSQCNTSTIDLTTAEAFQLPNAADDGVVNYSFNEVPAHESSVIDIEGEEEESETDLQDEPQTETTNIDLSSSVETRSNRSDDVVITFS